MVTNALAIVQKVAIFDRVTWLINQNRIVTINPLMPASFVCISIVTSIINVSKIIQILPPKQSIVPIYPTIQVKENSNK